MVRSSFCKNGGSDTLSTATVRRLDPSVKLSSLNPAYSFSPEDAGDVEFVSLKDIVADSDGKYQNPFTGRRVEWEDDTSSDEHQIVSR